MSSVPHQQSQPGVFQGVRAQRGASRSKGVRGGSVGVENFPPQIFLEAVLGGTGLDQVKEMGPSLRELRGHRGR